MKKIINFFKRLFKLIFGKDVRSEIDARLFQEEISKPMLGTVYQNGYSFDDEFIIKTLKEWENINTFREYCKKNGITTNRNDVKSNSTYNDQTEYNLKVIASDMKYKLDCFDEEHYQRKRLRKIEEWEAMRKNSDESRYDTWRKEGRLCPKCQKAPTNKKYSGLVNIIYDYTTGGPIGAGVHVSGTGKQEYQFHYIKCSECSYWQIYEYRETPSWWDDLWDVDCPFTSGDVINAWQTGTIKGHATDKYKSYEITRW